MNMSKSKISHDVNLEHFRDLQFQAERQQKWLDFVVEKYPGLNPITAIIMAGDWASTEYADALVAKGIPVKEAGNEVGSYARLDWFVAKYQCGDLPNNWLVESYPYEWMMADPDDTNALYLELWRKAWVMNGKTYIHDEKELPDGDVLRIYRGQMSYRLDGGIAWSTDYATANKFAHGSGLRVPVDGVVITAEIKRENIYAYITGRGEFETVLDPSHLMNARLYQSEKRKR